MNTRSIGILLVVILVSGCMDMPQAVVISPRVDVRASEIGFKHSININVIDERPRKTLGTRGAHLNGANLTIEGDLSATVQQALIEGLAKQNFKPIIGSNMENRELRVEIRNLDYITTYKLLEGSSLGIDTTFKAFCIRGTQRPYEQIYRGAFVRNLQFPQTDEENNTSISNVVSDAINSLLKDQRLLTCLSE